MISLVSESVIVDDKPACEALCIAEVDSICTAFQFKTDDKSCLIFTETAELKGD